MSAEQQNFLKEVADQRMLDATATRMELSQAEDVHERMDLMDQAFEHDQMAARALYRAQKQADLDERLANTRPYTMDDFPVLQKLGRLARSVFPGGKH